MLKVEDSHKPKRGEDGHDRWLAMQSAYAEYKRASEALERTPQLVNDLPFTQRLPLNLWERQRTAFERYLDARLEFLESWCTESDSRGAGPEVAPHPKVEESGVGAWRVAANFMPALPILAVIVLSMTAFSLISEQKQVRDVEAAHLELQAKLKRTRNALQPHAEKLNLAVPTQLAVIPRVELASSGSGAASPLQLTVRKSPAERQSRLKPALHVQPKQVAARQTSVLQTRGQRSGIPAFYSFSLAPSHEFKLVGPIRVSLRSIDAQRKRVSLSILSDGMQIEVQRLQVNQPVWINVGDPAQPLELVVDQIAGIRLEGHLVEPRSNKAELRAGQLKSKLPDYPSRFDPTLGK